MNFKRRLNRSITILLTTIMSLVLCGTSSNALQNTMPDTNVSQNDSYIPDFKYRSNSELNCDIASALYDAFDYKYINDEKKYVCPDDFGGAYIGLNDGKVHLRLVGSNTEYKKSGSKYIASIENTLDNNDLKNSIVIEKADISFNKLNEMMKVLSEIALDNSITVIGVNEEKNRLDVELLDISKKDTILKYLRNKCDYFDEKFISFEKGSPIKFTSSESDKEIVRAPATKINALGGSDTYRREYNNGVWHTYEATLGFNAYRMINGKRQYGVVTAAHFALNNRAIYNAKDIAIGTPTIRKFSGKVDAAFIPFNPNIAPSRNLNRLPNSTDLLQGHVYNGTILQNQETYKIGRSSGVTTGHVKNINAFVTVEGKQFSDILITTNDNKHGDSGGPVYLPVYENSKFKKNLLYGITFSGTANGWLTHVCKAQNIFEALNIKQY